MSVPEFVQNIIGDSPLEKGKRYIHPEDGEILITGGAWMGNHGLSNHWYWRVISTGETHNGYGDNWPEVKPAPRLHVKVRVKLKDSEVLETTEAWATLEDLQADGNTHINGKPVASLDDALKAAELLRDKWHDYETLYLEVSGRGKITLDTDAIAYVEVLAEIV